MPPPQRAPGFAAEELPLSLIYEILATKKGQKFLKKALKKHYKDKNVAILNDKTTYGKGLADEAKKALNKAGFKEKLFESYNKGDKDFNSIVSRLKRDNIDLVYIGGYHQEAGLILRQMRDALAEALADAEVKRKIEEQGADVIASSPEDCRTFLAREIERWGKVIQDNNIRVDS